MKTKGLIIEATCEQIIHNLQIEVEETQGRTLFQRTKSLASNMQFSCPFHSDGQERKPSCGMSREPSYSGSKIVEAGTVHCFTCNYTGDLQKFISDVFGRSDGGLYGNQWLKKHFLGLEEVIRQTPDFGFDKRKTGAKKVQEKQYKPISERELNRYRFYHDYMYERGLTNEIIEQFDVGYDEETDSITFPVHDQYGNAIFINRRGTKGKFHKYGEDDPKTEFIYGLYELYESDWTIEPVYVTESIINCLTLWVNGYYAISTMGLGGGAQYDILANSRIKNLIVAYDPDEAGQRGADRMVKILKNKMLVKKLRYPRYMYEEELDINDERQNLKNFL